MSFKYNNLDVLKRQIRLIRFLRNGKTPLEVYLETVSKNDNLKYHCLSYVWGDSSLIWPILINGVRVPITRNLGEALERLETEQEVEFLWADSLCINQSDLSEKESQMSMMRNIYADATAVLAWLGPEAESSGEVMDEIGRVGSIIIKHLFKIQVPREQLPGLIAAGNLGLHKMVQFVLDWVNLLKNTDSTGRRSIAPDVWERIGWERSESRLSSESWVAFFSRTFWTRIWILQELAVAREVYLFCGDRKQPLCTLFAVHKFLTSLLDISVSDALSDWYETISFSVLDSPIPKALCLSLRSRLLELMQLTAELDATIPQDRIFALLGLATDGDTLGIRVDYSKSLKEYLEIITREYFLSGIKFGYLTTETHPWACGSPSWVAQQSNGFSHELLSDVKVKILRTMNTPIFEDFRAYGKMDFVVSQTNFPRPGILKLPCHLVGIVNRTQPLEPTKNEYIEFIALVDQALRSLPPQIKSLFNTPNTISCLVTIGILRNIASFLGISVDRLPKELATSNKSHGFELWWLPIRHWKQPPENVESTCWSISDSALREGFCMLCSLSGGEGSLISKLSTVTIHDLKKWFEIIQNVRVSSQYAQYAEISIRGGLIFQTLNSYIGLGPRTLQSRDHVVILPDIKSPYIVRPAGADSEQTYTLIEEAYVLGIMYGELVNKSDVSPTWIEFC
jgi:hypothetical protein